MNERIIKFNEYDIMLKPFNIFLLYTYTLMILMYIAGGDGYLFGTIILVTNLLTSFFAFYYYREDELKQVKITEDKIEFKYIKNKRYRKSEFLLKNLQITAKIGTYMELYKIRYIRDISILLSISNTLQNNAVEYISDLGFRKMEHSLNILKFLKTLDCVTYEIVNDDASRAKGNVELYNAVKNYIEHDIFNKKDYKYPNKILIWISVILLSILLLAGMALLTIIYLDVIHLLP